MARERAGMATGAKLSAACVGFIPSGPLLGSSLACWPAWSCYDSVLAVSACASVGANTSEVDLITPAWAPSTDFPSPVTPRPLSVEAPPSAIARLRRVLIAPCTTTVRGLASEVILEPGEDPVPRRSAVNLDSIESVAIGVLIDRMGRLSDRRMNEICDALAVTVDCR